MSDGQLSLLKPMLIFVGSGTGGLIRYWLGGLIQNWWGPQFPLGTLVINVTGCFVMGFLATLWTGPVLIRDEYRAAVLVGLLGGYTTFSSFGRETLALAQDGEWWQVALYVSGSVGLSLVAVWLGALLAAKLYGAGAP